MRITGMDKYHAKNSNDATTVPGLATSLSIDKKDTLKRLRRRSIADLLDPPVIVNQETTLSKIISTLKKTNSYEVFVPVEGKIAALSIRDIIGITDIASTHPSLLGKIIPTLSKDTLIGEAARIMSLHRMRTLPVVENNKVVAQISAKRIVNLLITFANEGKIRIKASDVMTSQPVVIDNEHTAASAKAIMKRRRIDHLPVIDKDHLVGIITSSDIMDLMMPSERIGKRSIGVVNAENRLHVAVAGILSKEVVTADVQDSIHIVTNKMLNMDSAYCLIKLWDELQGIITYRDLVSLLGEKIQEEIPVSIIGLPDDPLEAELAKSKFAGALKFLRKIYPDIMEARCRIKLKDVKGPRKRYEVDAHIIWTHGSITYTDLGYDLARIFDEMSNALKKRISHKYGRKSRTSVRVQPPVQ
jgi:CBS domain-containing protein